MAIKKILILLFYIIPITIFSQSVPTKKQLTGSVLDIINNKGIEGVQVRLLSTGDIQYTDSEGKFKFFNENGFTIGEPIHSFVLYKEGYLNVDSNSNKVMFGSGDIGSLGMKLDIDLYLWITVIDGASGDFLSNVKIEIKGDTQLTNSQGRAKFDLSAFGNEKITAIFSLNCYKDEILEVPTKGEKPIRLISTCNSKTKNSNMDTFKASQILDRALKARNGSKQGQVEAMEFLRDNKYDFNSENFQGLNLEGLQLTQTNLLSTNFDYTNINDVNFSKSTLSSSRFHFAIAKNINLSKSNLSKSKAAFLQAPKGNFAGSNLTLTYFIGCDFSNADFSNANLDGALFAFCDFTGAKFNNAQITNAGIFGSILDDTEFTGALISNTDINGSVTANGNFTFNEIQKKGICQYIDSNRLYYLFAASKEFHFQLMEDTHSSYKRYDDIVNERYLFKNFGNSYCNICDTEKWSIGKWRDYFSFFKILKDQEFLKKNNRVQFTQNVVKNHLNLLFLKLNTENVYRVKSNFEFWDKKVKNYLDKKASNPSSDTLVNIEAITSQILKLQPSLESKIPWKTLAADDIGKYLKEEVSNYTIRGKSGYTEIKPQNLNSVPPSINQNTIPNTWVEYYKNSIKKKSKRQSTTLYFPINRYSIDLNKGKGTLKIKKGELLKNHTTEKEVLSNFLKKETINPDFIWTPRIDGTHFYGNDKNVFLNFVYPDNRISYDFETPSEINSKNIEARLEVKVESLKNIKFDEDAYFFWHLEPKVFQYRKKGTNNNWTTAYTFNLDKKPAFQTEKKTIKNKAIFNLDIALAALLNEKLLTIENLRMDVLARRHLDQAKTYKFLGKPFPYQYIFPNYTQSTSADYTLVYKEWLLKSAKLGVETFSLPFIGKSTKKNTIDVEFWNSKSYDTHLFLHQYLKENNIKTQQVVKLQNRHASLSYAYTSLSYVIDDVYVIYPHNTRYAEITSIDGKHTENLMCNLEVIVEKVIYKDKGKKMVIFHVTPKTLYYKLKNNMSWKSTTNFMP
ncbi:pentapeptide repeat-containing protein [Algibacter sp. 2305UL17-15]|uniref:pentapeptide repeat-containing protein n=1 Tax=Algibacter sp. 2305UL17-15 TaxID=3231268 RepID=UPI003459D2B4